MRSARAKDYWDKVTSRKHINYVKEIDLKNHNGINKIKLSGGICVICGLNGVGKTTVLSAIKTILGLEQNAQDKIKIGDVNIAGIVQLGEKAYECENIEGKRLADQYNGVTDNIVFVDNVIAKEAMDFFIEQDNVEELLEQNEDIELPEQDVEEIKYVVGKEYDKISLIEVEDLDKVGAVPYFEVISEGLKYNSRGMGIGEHFLIFLIWQINKAAKNSIIIIEEPETFIGIKSQGALMDFLAKSVAQKGLSFVITTHSPFVIENISSDNISILGRAANRVAIRKPDYQIGVNDILGSKKSISGTFFVEDVVAEIFLNIILEGMNPNIFRNYTIQSVGGESEVSQWLQYIKFDKIRYKFIGIYDGDMKEKIDASNLKWPFTFLPISVDVEDEMKQCFCDPVFINEFAEKTNKTQDEVILALSNVAGKDKHDWFMDLCRLIMNGDRINFVRSWYNIWAQKHAEELDKFIVELSGFCL